MKLLFVGEKAPPSFQLLEMRKRRVSFMITSAIGKDGVTHTTNRGILHNFVEFLQSKYDPIQVDDACVTQMEEAEFRTLPL